MEWLEPPWLLVPPRVLITIGIVLIVAYVPARLAVGAAMNRMLGSAYGTRQYREMVDKPGDLHHRAMAHAALPLWFRAVGKALHFALPVGIIVLVIGLVR